MIKIVAEYMGYSLIPPFNYCTLKTETIEISSLDEALMFLYEMADWDTTKVNYEDGIYSLNVRLGKTDFGDVVNACFKINT